MKSVVTKRSLKATAILLTASLVVVSILFADMSPARRFTVLLSTRPSCTCDSTEMWPRSLPVGQTQLEQYRRWENVTTHSNGNGNGNITRNQTMYTYDIRVVEATRKCSDVRVRLDEFYDGNRTVGGSCFLALTESPTERQVCSYTDYFNGTYTIWCPAPPTTCAVLTIQRQCVDFLVYEQPVHPLDELVLRRSVCPWSTITGCATHGHANSPATWLRNGTSWTVGYVRGEPVATLLDADAICECLRRKIDRFVMIGASHMRYKFDYLTTECLGKRSMDKVGRKHSTFRKNNIHFYLTTYSKHFTSLWENNLKKLHLTNNSVVLFQTGAHAVAHRGIANAIGAELDVYLKALVNIKSRADKAGFKMVVITSPPFPDHDRSYLRRRRNNYALAALSRLLQDKLSLYGVNVFDEFGVMLPQQNNDTALCGDHYLCRVPGKGVHGYVGITALRLLMTDICDD